jgi:hypothetical protein
VLLAALTHLRLVVEYYVIIPNKTVSCRIHCDSKGALARCRTNTRWIWHYWQVPHGHDLEVAIRTCILKLPIPITWHWVGHASLRKDPDDLHSELHETADEL